MYYYVEWHMRQALAPLLYADEELETKRAVRDPVAKQPTYNPFSVVRCPGDRGTGAQIIWTVYGTQLVAVIEAGYWRYPQSVA